MAQRLYCRNENAAAYFANGTCKVLALTDATASLQRRAGRWTSDLQGNSDTGQFFPFGPDNAPPAACAEVSNVAGAITATQGWVWDADHAGKTLPAGVPIPVHTYMLNEYLTNTSGRLLLRLLVIHTENPGSGWVNIVDANLLDTFIPGEVSHTAGQEGWAASDARLVVNGLTTQDWTLPGLAAPYTLAAGQYLFVQMGFADADSTSNRAWALRFGNAQVWLDLPDFENWVELEGSAAAVSTASGSLARVPPWLELARQRGRPCYWAARGYYNDGDTLVYVDWGTAQIQHPDKRVLDPRLVEPPGNIPLGVPSGQDGLPEDVTSMLRVRNVDGALGPYLVGGASLATEYLSHSVYNLRLKLFQGFLTDEGIPVEREMSPNLYLAGDATVHQDGTVTLPLSSRTDELLGTVSPSSRASLVTVEELREATFLEGKRALYLDGVEHAYAEAEWLDLHKPGWGAQHGGDVAPYLYGRTEFHLLLLGDVDHDLAQHFATWLAFVSPDEPDLTSFPDWRFYQEDAYGQIGRRRGHRLTAGGESFAMKLQLDDGTILWVVWISEFFGDRTDYDGDKDAWWVDVASGSARLSDAAMDVTPGIARYSPAGLIHRIIENHSKVGVPVDAVSFARASWVHRQKSFGGRIDSTAELAEICSHLAEAGGLQLYIGVDDKVHVCVRNGWNSWDRADVDDPGLPWITEEDVIEGWEETIPGPGTRGAPATRTTIDWPSERAEFWGMRSNRAPGATVVPLPREVEARFSGAWVYPPQRQAVFQSAASRNAQAWRFARFKGRRWLAYYAPGQYFRMRWPRALGVGGAYGWTDRVVRLEHREVLPADDAVAVIIRDYGRIAGMRPWKLDALWRWVRYDSNGSGLSITLTATSDVIEASGGTPFADAGVGDAMWLDGAANAANRRHLKVTEAIDDTHVRVEFALSATETIAAQGGAADTIDATWLLMRTHASPDCGATFRPAYGRLCSEQTAGGYSAGKFSNDDDGYRLMEG